MAGMWYYSDKREQKGPIAFDELRRLVQAGAIRPGDLVWQEGTSDWVRASQVDGLFDSSRDLEPGPRDEPGPRRRPAREDRYDREERRPIRDDFDDRPRRRPQKSSRGLVIGLIIGGAALLVIGIVVLIIVLVSGGSDGNRNIVPSRAGTRVSGSITTSDPRDGGGFGGGGYSKTYTAQFTAGKTYTIEYNFIGGGRGAMDPFLRLLNPGGAQVAADDDGGFGLNSRITYRADVTGPYRIVCTTLGAGQTGNFELIVREH